MGTHGNLARPSPPALRWLGGSLTSAPGEPRPSKSRGPGRHRAVPPRLHEGARELSVCGAASLRGDRRPAEVTRFPRLVGAPANHAPRENGLYLGGTAGP